MITENDIEDFLSHHGVKGMKWGIRHDGPEGVSRKTNREAKKDAKEFARAKMYYGEGAGNRRKLIKASVEAKSKKSAAYAKAFDHHLKNQDMSTHAEKARGERKSTDRRKTAKQGAGALARRFTGEMGTTAAFIGVAAAGAAYAKSPKARAMMQKGMHTVKNGADNMKRQQGAKKIADFLNNHP